MPQPPVYFDHAATTPVRPEVLDAMLPYLGSEAFGNPSSAHHFGRVARAGVERARQQVAEALGAETGQVVFTSGGTEADNLAVIGAALAARKRGGSMAVVVSAVEHKAVLAAAHAVAELGGVEVVLPVTRQGIVQMDALDQALVHQPAVVSVMWVNNETGVIQPIQEIAQRCEAARVPFHTDAVQAMGKIDIDVARTGCSLLTISGHKIGAPKGIGALVARRPDMLEPIVHGGSQQAGVRPGTENVPGIIGLGQAVALAAAEQSDEAARLTTLREALVGHLRKTVPDIVVIGDGGGGPLAPHILNVLIPGTDSEAMIMHLDLAGIAVSTGSACNTGAVEPSHVLTAMGIPETKAITAIRFSLGHESSSDDVVRAADVVPGCVNKVRKLAGALSRG
jgi:cysteine desulfurase